MNTIFLKLVNMSISASWLVFAVLILRMVLKKAPKWVNVLLWGFVALRLVFPFSFESVLSLIPSAETVPIDIEVSQTPVIDSGIPPINSIVNPIISQGAPADELTSVNPMQVIVGALSYIWVTGVALMLVYTAFSYLRLKGKVGTAVRLRDNIYQSENVTSPFVLGIIKPRIYLPFSIGETETEHVIAHEMAHIKRKDHLWKPFGFLILSLYWFNPVIWAAYVLLCRDIELACDERVIKALGCEGRAEYTEALLSLGISRRSIAACPLAFGEVGIKARVKSVMNYKKPAFWIILTSVIACIAVALCFLTNPKKELKLNIPEAAKITVFSGADGVGTDISDADEIKYITDNINSLEFSKDGSSRGTDGFAYSLTWYDASGKRLDSLTVMTETRISYGGYFYDSKKADAEIDISWLGALFEAVPFKANEIFSYKTDRDTATLSLSTEDNRFSFVLSYLSSYLPCGTYEEKDGYLTLKTDDGENTYTFQRRDDTLVFNAALSSEMPKYAYELGAKTEVCVPDSAVFKRGEADPLDNMLTLGKLKELVSEKGDTLTWSDFEGFYSREIGSGLYILQYPLADAPELGLAIGGDHTRETPLYINLGYSDGSGSYIDVRYSDIDSFISSVKKDDTVYIAPPRLTVRYSGDETDAHTFEYLWNYRGEDGKYVRLDGTQVKNIDEAEKLPTLTVYPKTATYFGEWKVFLNFESDPDEVSVTRRIIKDGKIAGEREAVQLVDYGDETEDKFHVLIDAGESYAYEVTARWSDRAGYYGTARFSFRALYSAQANDTKPTMTLKQLKELISKRGGKVTVGDLSEFYGSHIASGFWVMGYPVEEDFFLHVSMGNSDEPDAVVTKIYLRSRDGYSIELPEGDIDGFVTAIREGVYRDYDKYGIIMSTNRKSEWEIELIFEHSSEKARNVGELWAQTADEYELKVKSKHNGYMSFDDYIREELGFKEHADTVLGFDSYAKRIERDGMTVFTIPLKSYGKTPLFPATYLLCKKISLITDQGAVEEKVYTAEFAVSDRGENRFAPIVDEVNYDIDGDGNVEQGILRYTPDHTSLTPAYLLEFNENGSREYVCTFSSDINRGYCSFGFEVSQQSLRLIGDDEEGRHYTVYVSLDGGKISFGDAEAHFPIVG